MASACMSKEYNQEFPSRRRGKESVCSPSGWKSANESKCVCALAGGAKTEAVTRGPWQKGRQKIGVGLLRERLL